MTNVSSQSFNVLELVEHLGEYEDEEFYEYQAHPNSLKERQRKYAPTRREKIIEKRREGYQSKKKTEVKHIQ